jgi:hypothetical protein
VAFTLHFDGYCHHLALKQFDGWRNLVKKTFLTYLVLIVLSTVAHAHGKKHVHGEGRLDVAVDQGHLSLNLMLPLDAAVGFERKPKNDKEKATLEAAEKTLKDAGLLWAVNLSARCQLVSVQVSLPKLDGGHADIDASYAYRCANPSDLKTIETSLFKSFKRLYRLEVQHVSAKGQGAVRLTPKNPELRW